MDPRYTAFGLTLTTTIVLPWPASNGSTTGRPVSVVLSSPERIADAWSGPNGGPTWDTWFPGGRRVTVERGVAGDQLIRHADRDMFLLSAQADRLVCAPTDAQDPSWRRFLLDTVLWWTALANGLHVLHASAVETPAGVIGFVSATGGGKSTLASELIRRGAALFSDDILAIERGDELVVHPGPPVMNLSLDQQAPLPQVQHLAVLHEGESEAWIAVSPATRSSQALAALFLYGRGPDLELGVARRTATVLDLIPHAWGIPDRDASLGDRFTMLSDLADSVPIFTLTADEESSVGVIADTVEDALASLQGSGS